MHHRKCTDTQRYFWFLKSIKPTIAGHNHDHSAVFMQNQKDYHLNPNHAAMLLPPYYQIDL